MRLAVGPAGEVLSVEASDWPGQRDTLMASGGELTPVDTANDLFGIEIARVVPALNPEAFAEKPVAFDTVEFQ